MFGRTINFVRFSIKYRRVRFASLIAFHLHGLKFIVWVNDRPTDILSLGQLIDWVSDNEMRIDYFRPYFQIELV